MNLIPVLGAGSTNLASCNRSLLNNCPTHGALRMGHPAFRIWSLLQHDADALEKNTLVMPDLQSRFIVRNPIATQLNQFSSPG